MSRAPLSRAIYSSFSAQAVAAALGFVISPMLVSDLGQERYGVWALIAEILAYYTMLDFGVRGAVSYYIARYLANQREVDANQVLASAFWALLPIGALAALAGSFIAYNLPNLFAVGPVSHSEIFVSMSILALVIGMDLPMEALSSALKGRQRIDLLNGVEIAGQLVSGAAILVALNAGGLLVAVAAAQACGRLARWALLATLTRRTVADLSIWPRHFRLSQARLLAGFGTRKIAIDVAQLVLTRTDLIIVGSLLEVKWVAYYSLARLVPRQLYLANLNITRSFTPWLTDLHAKGDRAVVRNSFLFGSTVSVLFSVLGTVCVLGFVHHFLRLWVGSRFVEGHWSMRSDVVAILLMLAFLPQMMQGASAQLVFASGRPEFLARVRGAQAILNIVLSVILVRSYGLAGVAFATLAAVALVELVMIPQFVRKELGVSPAEWFGRVLPRAILAGLLLAAVIAAILSIQEPLTWEQFFLETGVTAGLAAVIGLSIGLRADQRRVVLARVPGLRRLSDQVVPRKPLPESSKGEG